MTGRGAGLRLTAGIDVVSPDIATEIAAYSKVYGVQKLIDIDCPNPYLPVVAGTH